MECKLPINLRQFLARQFAPGLEAGNEAILGLAANADPATLSKLARAIRRYSTERAHEAWAECAVALARFDQPRDGVQEEAILCLKCASIEFRKASAATHHAPDCLTVNLTPGIAGDTASPGRGGQAIAARLQHLVEEFRALRVAFGLPHFELDCYVRNRQVVLTWRPLP